MPLPPSEKQHIFVGIAANPRERTFPLCKGTAVPLEKAFPTCGNIVPAGETVTACEKAFFSRENIFPTWPRPHCSEKAVHSVIRSNAVRFRKGYILGRETNDPYACRKDTSRPAEQIVPPSAERTHPGRRENHFPHRPKEPFLPRKNRKIKLIYTVFRAQTNL